MMKTKEINAEQMCCFLCGYIAPQGEPYESEPSYDDGDDYPICPKCGEFNFGGYPSFQAFHSWSQGAINEIIRRGIKED